MLMAIHLDPGNQEVVSLLPRLFPGKSVRDVLQSRAALQARANLSSTVCPIKLQPIANMLVQQIPALQAPSWCGVDAPHVIS